MNILKFLLIILPSYSFAAEAPLSQTPTNGLTSQLFLLGGFIIIFYFLMWRPQSKRAKAHQTLITNLAKNDEIVTNGGIIGQVTEIKDAFIKIKVNEQTEIVIQKQAIACTLPKGTLESI